jgi:hypothetical protein
MFSEILFDLHWFVICANVCKGKSNGFRQLTVCCDVIVNCVIGGWGFNFVNLNWGGAYFRMWSKFSVFYFMDREENAQRYYEIYALLLPVRTVTTDVQANFKYCARFWMQLQSPPKILLLNYTREFSLLLGAFVLLFQILDTINFATKTTSRANKYSLWWQIIAYNFKYIQNKMLLFITKHGQAITTQPTVHLMCIEPL